MFFWVKISELKEHDIGNWCLTSLGYLQTLRSFSFNNIDSKSGLKTKLTLIKMISIFLLWIFHFYVGIFQQHLYMEYISVTSGAGTAYLSGATQSNPVSTGIRVVQFFVFCLVFCRSLLVILSVLYYLSFDLRLPIIPLGISSNFSHIYIGSVCFISERNWSRRKKSLTKFNQVVLSTHQHERNRTHNFNGDRY